MTTTYVRPLIPFGVACVGIALFSLMDAAMKDLSIALGAYNAVLWRNILGATLSGFVFIAKRQRWPKNAVLKLHMWRSCIVAMMAVAFFWGLARMPIAEAIGLSFIAPVIALFLAAVLLGEKIGNEAIIASFAGLAGVGIILTGKFSGNYTMNAVWGAGAVLSSAVMYAYNLVLARKQAQQAGAIEIVFFQSFCTASILMIAAPWFLAALPLAKLPMLTGASLLALVSLLLLSWAYARAEAQILIPVEYTGFVWAMLFGWMFFAEAVSAPTLFGTVLIVVGSVIAARAKPARVTADEPVVL